MQRTSAKECGALEQALVAMRRAAQPRVVIDTGTSVCAPRWSCCLPRRAALKVRATIARAQGGPYATATEATERSNATLPYFAPDARLAKGRKAPDVWPPGGALPGPELGDREAEHAGNVYLDACSGTSPWAAP